MDIPIEERSATEVLGAWGVPGLAKGRAKRKAAESVYVRIANPGSAARNPGFDVTPAELITGIITPAGIVKPKALWRSDFAWDTPGREARKKSTR